MSQERIYKHSDVVMLTASQTIAGSFKSCLTELSTLRTDWTEQYADDLQKSISDTLKNHFGIDPQQGQRAATAALYALQAPAKRGFTANLRKVQKDNTEALVKLLFEFKKNLTDDWKAQITAKGLHPALIDRICGYADSVNQANVDQEGAKSGSVAITDEVVDAFNAIYGQVIGICKKASDYYFDDPVKQALFTFSVVVKKLGAAHKAQTATVTAA